MSASKRLVTAFLTPAIALVLLTVLLGNARPRAVMGAQEDVPRSHLEIATIDLSEFPIVGLNLIATDARSRPMRDLGALRLRENGVPVADYTIAPLTAGVNVVFVVDANRRIQESDDESGLTRLQKVKDSILLFSGRFMDLAQRDRVSVLVPDGTNGRFLIEDEASPAALIEAVRTFDPGRLPQADPVNMVALALEKAAEGRTSGRFQAVVLFSDAAELNSFRFAPLIERAQELQTPILILLLGGTQPNEDALDKVQSLAEPTRGFVVHMRAAADSSELFQVLVDNSVQSQVRYESNIKRSGTYTVAVSLNNLSAERSIELALAPPQAFIRLAQTTIVRAGAEPDAPVDALQPAVQPVEVLITWPDGRPRPLQGASLVVDGAPQVAPFVAGSGADGAQTLIFDWLIQDLEGGRYALSALVTDTLGLTAHSDAVAVTIELARPNPVPTPLPTVTPQPLQLIRDRLPPIALPALIRSYAAPLGGAIVFLILIVIVLRRRLGAELPASAEQSQILTPETKDKVVGPDGDSVGEKAFLKAVGEGATHVLERSNTTIGSDEQRVQLHLADDSVSALHARIRSREGAYWLYDEGSQQGTLLNHERLGLAPRALHHKDEIQIGRLRFIFLVVKVGDEDEGHVGLEG